MPIPDYQSIMQPLLKRTSDRKEHTFRELIETKIELIDGEQLTQLMIDYNLGVAPQQKLIRSLLEGYL